ncbi:MAG: hypothetical protein H6710_05140 [Myxococcales bacterium]|nr:hypothetical protein [Myxococcales bacterium]
MVRWRRALEALWALSLAVVIVAPALTGALKNPVGEAIGAATRKISVSQRWQMYAPDAQHSLAYVSIRGRFADGREEPLLEALEADEGWGAGNWWWTKDRAGFWRFYAAVSRKKGSAPIRTWYVKSLCVREARRSDDPPLILLVDRVTRSFNAPEKVLAGAPEYGPVVRTPVQKINCMYRPIQEMIAEDEARRGARG